MQAAWYLPWVFATVAVGAVYLAAMLVERSCSAPARRRLVWQVASGCTLVLGVSALTGLDRAVGTLLWDSLFPHSQASAATLALPIDSGVAAGVGAAAFTDGTEIDRPGARSAIANPTFNDPAAATNIGRVSLSPGDSPESRAYGSPPAHAESSTESAARVMGADYTRASLLGGIWLLGAFAVLLRQQWAYLRLRSACRPKRKLTDGPIPRFVTGWAAQLGLPPRIPVYLLPGLKTPAAFGIFRPALGLPEKFTTTHLDPAEQAILLHELAHLASRDPVWRYLAGLGSAVLWWHPAAWVIRRRLHWACELAADEASLLLTDGPRQLARGLLRYGRIVCPGLSSVVGVGGDGFGSALARRVARLMNLSRSGTAPDRRSAVRTASTTTIVVTALAVVFSTVWAGVFGPLPQEEGGTVMTRFAVSWRGSLSAVTLAAFLSPWSASAAEEGRREGPPPGADRPPAMERERDQAPERDRDPERDRREGERREGMDRPRPPQPDAVREEIEQAMRRIQGAQAELKERAQALRREMAGASDEAKARIREAMEGLEREMRELEAKKREIMESFALRRPPEKPDGPPPIARLEHRLEELRKEIARAREEHRMDAVERLEKQIAETERLLHNAREGGPRPPEAGPPGPPAEVLERRIAELREQLGRAREEGKEELVRELERRIEELHRQLRGRAEGRPLPPPFPPERMERIRRAAELLRREGLGDMAELLLQSARPKPPGPPVPPPHREGPPPPPHHDGPPPPHEPR